MEEEKKGMGGEMEEGEGGTERGGREVNEKREEGRRETSAEHLCHAQSHFKAEYLAMRKQLTATLMSLYVALRQRRKCDHLNYNEH